MKTDVHIQVKLKVARMINFVSSTSKEVFTPVSHRKAVAHHVLLNLPAKNSLCVKGYCRVYVVVHPFHYILCVYMNNLMHSLIMKLLILIFLPDKDVPVAFTV